MTKDTPEVENWFTKLLSRHGVDLYSLEGYAVRDTIISAVFERRKSSISTNNWTIDEIIEYLENDGKEKN